MPCSWRQAIAQRAVTFVVSMLLWLASGPLLAFTVADLKLNQVQAIYPAAQRLGDVTGEIAMRPVYNGNKLLGYVVVSTDVAPIPAYSGKPIAALIGLRDRDTVAGELIASF